MHRRTILAAAAVAPAAALGAATPAHANSLFPSPINLPNGWRPEGIAAGLGTRFFVGSLADGAIYRGDIVSGEGAVYIPGTVGTATVGLEIDFRRRIWACGGNGGGARVYSEFTGDLLGTYAFGGTFVNDAAVTPFGAYFTDSGGTSLHHVPLGFLGRLPDPSAARSIALPPGLGDAGASNNGIVSTPDGRLIIVQSAANRLWLFNPNSGAATQIDTGGASVERGDGMLRRGLTLYVVRNRLNLIAKFQMNSSFTTAMLEEEITSPDFDVPTTIAPFGAHLYACNARFTTPPTPDTTYTVVRVHG